MASAAPTDYPAKPSYTIDGDTAPASTDSVCPLACNWASLFYLCLMISSYVSSSSSGSSVSFSTMRLLVAGATGYDILADCFS